MFLVTSVSAAFPAKCRNTSPIENGPRSAPCSFPSLSSLLDYSPLYSLPNLISAPSYYSSVTRKRLYRCRKNSVGERRECHRIHQINRIQLNNTQVQKVILLKKKAGINNDMKRSKHQIKSNAPCQNPCTRSDTTCNQCIK